MAIPTCARSRVTLFHLGSVERVVFMDCFVHPLLGIGEDIASRLNAAAQCFVERSGEMTLQKVRALKSGTTLEYLRGGVVTKGRKNVPFLSQQPQAAFQSTGIRLGTLGNDDVPIRSTQNDAALRDPTSVVSSSLNTSFSQPAFSSADVGFDLCMAWFAKIILI